MWVQIYLLKLSLERVYFFVIKLNVLSLFHKLQNIIEIANQMPLNSKTSLKHSIFLKFCVLGWDLASLKYPLVHYEWGVGLTFR